MKVKTTSVLLILLILIHSVRGQEPSGSPCCSPTPGPTQGCCDGKTYDKTPKDTKVSGDFGKVLDELNKFAHKLKLDGSGCEFKAGAFEFSLTGSKYDECCDGDQGKHIHHATDVKGDIKLTIGDIGCKANLLTELLPSYLTALLIGIDGSAKINTTGVTISNSCEGQSNCFTLSGFEMALTISGTATFGPNVGDEAYTQISCEGTGSAEIKADLCLDKESGDLSIKNPSVTPKVEAVLKYKLGHVEKEIFKIPIYDPGK